MQPAKTPAEIAELKAEIKRLEAAYESVVTGGQVIQTQDQNGEMVRFQQANSSALYDLISMKRRCLPPELGGGFTAIPTPLTFLF